jgi:hypothetical protein
MPMGTRFFQLAPEILASNTSQRNTGMMLRPNTHGVFLTLMTDE